jgi:hypothetical protein
MTFRALFFGYVLLAGTFICCTKVLIEYVSRVQGNTGLWFYEHSAQARRNK